MNFYNIKIDYNDIKEPSRLNWTAIRMGISSTYFTDDVAIKHAVSEVTEGATDENIISIACALSGDDIRPYLNIRPDITLFEVADEIHETDENDRAKVVCAILEGLYSQKEKFSNLTEVVNMIVADFYYPLETTYVLNYGDVDVDRNKIPEILKKWHDYLEKFEWGVK